jgi:hypothetical protein
MYGPPAVSLRGEGLAARTEGVHPPTYSSMWCGRYEYISPEVPE